jgi:PAS domain S-box-containing protein
MDNNPHKQSVLFKNILDRISDALLFESFDHKIVYVNHYFCNLFHIPVAPEFLVGMDCSNAAQESKQYFKDPEQFVQRIAQIYEQAEQAENVKDEKLSFADGLTILRDYQFFNSEDTQGHLWVYKNVSSLVTSLDAMTSQKNFFENLLNNIPADIAIFNKEHQYEFVNKVGVKSTEMSKWIIGKDDFDYVHYKQLPEEFAIRRRKAFKQAYETRKSIELEEINHSKIHGDTHTLRKFYPVFEDDKFVSMIGYGIDITRMRQSEIELAQSHALFLSMIEHSNELVLTMDADRNVHFVNSKWTSVTGHALPEVGFLNLESIISVGKKTFLSAIGYYFKNEKHQGGSRELTISTKQGDKVNLRYQFAKFIQKDWKSPRIIVFLTDITEQVRIEEEFKKNLAREKYLNELKTNFMNMVSHELRTPLSVILSNTELLMMRLQHFRVSGIERYTNTVMHQIDGMTNLLNEFLFVSKVESGKFQLQIEELSVVSFLEDLVKEHYQPWKDKRSIDFMVVGIPVDIHFDKRMMFHIVNNLLSNAFKYSEGKPAPSLNIRFLKKKCQIIVEDQGIGISAEDQKKLFQPFSRGTNVDKIEGTGLGLVVVKYFIEQHKGTLHIDSEIGKYTKISLELPYNLD